MIDQVLKRCLGQMMHGVQVVGAADGGTVRLYTSHWVSQVSFEEPVVMASVSPKHDTHPLISASGVFSVSILAGDQIAQGQYFSYPGRRFHYLASEFVTSWEAGGGLPVVPDAIGWMRCEVFQTVPMLDHDLMFARVTAVQPGRLREPPLLYSSRLGWRIAGEKAREPGRSIRDELLARLVASGIAVDDVGEDEADA